MAEPEIDFNKIMPIISRRFGGPAAMPGGAGSTPGSQPPPAPGVGFAVTAPQIVRDDPTLLKADDAAQKLAGTQWDVRLHDGSYSTTLSFEELMLLVYNIVALARGFQDAKSKARDPAAPVTLRVQSSPKVLTPENVKGLLSSLDVTIPPPEEPPRQHNLEHRDPAES
jgi:hypothetical protein